MFIVSHALECIGVVVGREHVGYVLQQQERDGSLRHDRIDPSPVAKFLRFAFVGHF